MSRTTTGSRGDWREAARCAETDPEAFFPDAGKNPLPAALATCAGCDVRSDCLDFALENRESGVWGGTTDAQRRGMRRSGR